MNNKRNPHSYKCLDGDYKKAMKRAKKEKITLSELIELFVSLYSNDSCSDLVTIKDISTSISNYKK